jgi:hypothetical protein
MKDRMRWVGHISRMTEMQKAFRNVAGNTKLKRTDRCS